MQVTNADKARWGSYPDRKDSFDDEQDALAFKKLVRSNKKLQSYIESFNPSTQTYHLIDKQFGQYKVDMSMVDSSDNVVADIELERWSQWDATWPSYYKHIHFLGRKEKFFKDRPFFMVYLNKSMNKCMCLEKSVFEHIPTINKYFRYKKVWEYVKEIPLSEGVIYS
tara:strand:+ start:496 stop:996 length:501 start_codon:yes stop_codon:yes gene_type:complete